jgi:hypothetical protein
LQQLEQEMRATHHQGLDDDTCGRSYRTALYVASHELLPAFAKSVASLLARAFPSLLEERTK